MVFHVLSVALAVLYANAFEWFVHKYVLHGWGLRKGSFWSYHWHTHHQLVRRHGLADPEYQHGIFASEQRTKETLGVLGATATHLVLLPFAPWFVLTLFVCAVRYLSMHSRSHQDPEWARRHVPWHVEHHFGPNPHANWCLTAPWFDSLMGTRVRSEEKP